MESTSNTVKTKAPCAVDRGRLRWRGGSAEERVCWPRSVPGFVFGPDGGGNSCPFVT